jgi:tetratricopeptide (TPR) repeat protein
MATYKKRGSKSHKHQNDNLGQESTTAEVFDTLDQSASRSEAWVAQYQNYILSGIGAIVVVILTYLAYDNFIVTPKAMEADEEMFQAQQYFDQALLDGENADSLFTLSLEGGEGKYGFLDIIDHYSGTSAANIATYSAGMAYLNLKKFDKAIEYLNDFSSDDMLLNALSLGGIADAFAEINQLDDALEYYEKAVAVSDNSFSSPRFLFKAGQTAMALKKYDTALKHFKTIKDTYPSASEASQIDIYIGQASQ